MDKSWEIEKGQVQTTRSDKNISDIMKLEWAIKEYIFERFNITESGWANKGFADKEAIIKKAEGYARSSNEKEDQEFISNVKKLKQQKGLPGNEVPKIASMLDEVADSLESNGFLKEAAQIDIISNTLEQYGDTPKIGWNKFVDRHLDPNFAGTKVTHAQKNKLLREANRLAESNQLQNGPVDYIKYAIIKDPSIKSSIAKITPENKDKLKTRMTKRRGKEDGVEEEEFEQRYFEAKDVQPMPSDHVKLVLYSREQLESEPGGNPVGTDYDIVSINAEPTPSGTPMSPETMRRNMKGKEYGGSGRQHSPKELTEAESFWENHSLVM